MGSCVETVHEEDVFIKIDRYIDEKTTLTEIIQVSSHEHHDRLHRYIGPIISEHNKQKVFGTGILISSNLVLTVAHNVYHSRQRRENTNIQFYPGFKGHLKNSDDISSRAAMKYKGGY